MHFPLQAGGCESAHYAGADHNDQRKNLKSRNRSADKAVKKTAALRNQDDQQGINNRRFCVHGKKVMEYDDVHGAAADSQKCGDQSQKNPYQPADSPAPNMAGLDAPPKTDVEKDSKGKNPQSRGLDAANQMIRTGQTAQDAEQPFSQYAAKGCANPQRQAALPLQTVGFSVFIYGDRRHRQNSQPRQKRDGRNRHDARRIQQRFGQYAAANAAQAANDAGGKANQKSKQIYHLKLHRGEERRLWNDCFAWGPSCTGAPPPW